MWSQQWGSRIYYSEYESNARGVCVLFNPRIKVKVNKLRYDNNGRFVVMKVEINEKSIVLRNIYAPNDDSPQFYLDWIQKVSEFLSEGEDMIVLGGDFNLVMDPAMDRLSSANNHYESHTVLTTFMEEAHLCDIWRDQHPAEKIYSWCRQGKFGSMASRIDMILISESMSDSIRESNISYGFQTDHSLVDITICESEVVRGPGSWKLNNQILDNEDYQQAIKNIIEKVNSDSPYLQPDEKWIATKRECINLSKTFCKLKCRKKKNWCDSLCVAAEDLKADLNQNPGNSAALKSLKQINHQINNIKKLDTESAIFRSKAKWFREGEVSSKFFFSLEKKRYMEKNMNCIIDDNGRIITDQDEILDEQTRFYANLYRRNPSANFRLQRENWEPHLTSEESESCEQPLSKGELFDAVMTLRSGKCPGLDGLTVEFYRKFFKELSDLLLSMYQDSFEKGMLPLSARRGLISLLNKKGKDSRYIRHRRPLTLQNYDYKILAKAMDNRIKLVMDKLIDHTQTGFVKGRNIADNLRKTLDIIEYCKITQKAAVILSVDMEKCFDKLSHEAIFSSLKYFGFGPIFSQWTSLFFKDFEICTQNMGFMSEFFKKEQGVNQGCPLSPSLFLLSGAILANKLKSNSSIKGITIGSTEILLSQFADDMDLYLSYSKTCLNSVIHIFNIIEESTGLKVSYDKTTVYRIGSLANSNAKVYTSKELKWSNEYVETLGINMSNDKDILTNNFNKVIEKMETVSKIWYYRQLTLTGKVLIINTLISSLLVYKMQVLHNITSEQMSKMDEIITDFLWKDKRPKLSLKILRKDKSLGGLGLVDMEVKHMSLKVGWIKRIEMNPEIKVIASYFLGDKAVENNLIWKCNISPEDAAKIRPESFWKDLLVTWSKIHFYDPQDGQNVREQILYLNSHVKTNMSTARLMKLNELGICSIEDIVHESGEFKSREMLNQECESRKLSHLEYNSLITAIPGHWKFFLKSTLAEDVQIDKWKLIESSAKVSRAIYHCVIQDDVAWIHSGKMWKIKLGEAFDTRVHMESFKNIRKVTNIVKYRDFQYRLLHNKIFCNDILFHWKIKTSQDCELCTGKIKQTIVHLLWECPAIARFWRDMNTFLYDHNSEQAPLEFSCRSILYNIVHPKPGHVFNFAVLTAKFYIYRCKINEEIPEFQTFIWEWNYIKNIEYFNATVKNNLARHQNKWNIFEQ